MKDLILGIEQGVHATTAILVNHDLRILGRVTVDIPQYSPQVGWFEQDVEEIWQSVVTAIGRILGTTGVSGDRIAAIGLCNQRDSVVLWDRNVGEPVYRLIMGQDLRTAAFCEQLRKKGFYSKFKKKTGLVLYPSFAGTKIRWILDNVEGAQEKAQRGDLAFGTVDSYLVYRLTGGSVHLTDVTNASRTLLMNLEKLAWDKELLKTLNIPESLLPKIVSCSEIHGQTCSVEGLPNGIPIAGLAGDQQASLFGQSCFEAGEANCHYGDSVCLMINTGRK
ncbi:MAG: FGGY family carbohydrate kinase, partial [bacterium]|nr:FGGY family carbohydrate kinase [bacterium]